MKSINLSFPFEVFLNVCVYSICIQTPVESRRKCQLPGNLIYRRFWTAWCGHWESNSGLLEEEQALLIPELHSSSTVNTRILSTPCLPLPLLHSSVSPSFTLFSSIYIFGTVLYCLALDDLEPDFVDQVGLRVTVIFSFVILSAGLIGTKHKVYLKHVFLSMCAHGVCVRVFLKTESRVSCFLGKFFTNEIK